MHLVLCRDSQFRILYTVEIVDRSSERKNSEAGYVHVLISWDLVAVVTINNADLVISWNLVAVVTSNNADLVISWDLVAVVTINNADLVFS